VGPRCQRLHADAGARARAGPAVSVTERKARTLACGPGGLLGSAQAESGEGESGRARRKGGRGRWAAGYGCTAAELGWAKAGPKITRREKYPFFSFSFYNISKHFPTIF
jgi:hypothetical protein